MRPTLALLRSSHPGPVVAVTTVTVLLGVAGGLEPARVGLLGAVMLANQLSIGWANDWIDAARDAAAGRRDKPVARGEVGVAVVRAAAIAAAVVAIALSPFLGIPFALAHAVALAGGWAYDLGLKRTVASAVPYLVSFGILPLLPTLARPEPALATGWAIGAGALLGLAAHISNVLPDLADDAATGVLGMPHRLGRIPSTLLAGVALAGAGSLVSIGLWDGNPALGATGLVVSLALSAAAVGFALRGSRWGFRLVMIAAVVDVALLVLAGARMVVPLPL